METFPEHIRNAATAAGLGEVQRRYSAARRWWMFALGVFSLVGPLILITGPFEDDNADLVVGLGLTAACLPLWWDLIRRLHGGVYWCEHGILMADRWRKPRSFQWDDVAHLWSWDSQGFNPVTYEPISSRGCDIELADGSHIRFDESYIDADGKSLVDRVEPALTKLLFQRRLRQVRTDGRGEFGPITVEPTGLRTQSRVVSWNEIAIVEIRSARLRVLDRDDHVHLSCWARRIPEQEVLFQVLIDHGITVRPEGER